MEGNQLTETWVMITPYNPNASSRPPVYGSASAIGIEACGTGSISRQPFSSSPVGVTVPLPKFLLDESVMIQDFGETFEKPVYVAEVMKERDVSKWKKEEITSAIKQLGRIYANIVQDTGRDIGITEDDEEGKLIGSLSKVFAVLEPSQITPASISSVVCLGQLRLLQKKKLISSLKSQTAELKLRRQKVKDMTVDIQDNVRNINKKLQNYQEQLISTDLNEIQLAIKEYKAEINSEMDDFVHIETMESICNGSKIDATISEIVNLCRQVDHLKTELDFTNDLPLSIREIRGLIEERKKRYQEICEKVEDLTDYQFNP